MIVVLDTEIYPNTKYSDNAKIQKQIKYKEKEITSNNILIEKKLFPKLSLYMHNMRYIYYRPSSSAFIFYRRIPQISFVRFFSFPAGKRAFLLPAESCIVSSRNFIAFHAAHKHDCTREVFREDPFGFFHLFISDKSFACDNFVSHEVSSRTRNFRFSPACYRFRPILPRSPLVLHPFESGWLSLGK